MLSIISVKIIVAIFDFTAEEQQRLGRERNVSTKEVSDDHNEG